MINRILVQSRLSLILELAGHLDALAQLPEREFLDDPRNAAAAESFMRRALEAVFDVGRHILARTGHGDLAKEYKSIAHALGSLRVVPESYVPTLMKMAGYRDRMVHLYHEVSPEELREAIRDRRDDLRKYVDFVVAHLDKA